MNDKLSIIIGNKKFSAFVAGLVFLLIIPLVIQFILIAQSDIEGHEKVEKLVRDQENIALILIGVGTFLSGRRIILTWLDDSISPQSELRDETSRMCEINGFYLILLGSFMEVLDQLILHIESLVDIGVILELTFNFPLDLLSSFILARLCFKILCFKQEPEKNA
jgi:hypothetical protein